VAKVIRPNTLASQDGLLEAKANAAELEAEKATRAPAAAESLPLDVPEKLLNEAEEATTRRARPYNILAAKKVQLEQACAALAPDFKDIVRVVIDNLDRIIGHLNGRDLHQHQTSCEALLQASFRLVNECLAASCWVEKSGHLVASLENVEAAKEVYDQCMRHFYPKAGDDEVQAEEDDAPDRTPSLPDAGGEIAGCVVKGAG
jgi:hypothetical protein